MNKASYKVLVIDDEPDVTRALRLTISIQEPDWEILEVNDGEKGLLLLDKEQPDIVLLDQVMPGLMGTGVLERIRQFSDVPVIMLTVRDDELEKVRALEMGADDYIVKPFGHLELMARIHSVLRRASGNLEPSLEPLISGELRIDFNQQQATISGRPIRLTSTEFQLLAVLARNAGQIVPSETLLVRIWGRYALESDYLKVYIHRLRAKLGDDPEDPVYIQTARGIGYRLMMPESRP